MAENLIPKIAKMLGVELGEEFKVRSIFGGSPNNKIYHFGTKELFYTHEKNQNKIKDEYTLTELINGDCEIIKLPWKPKKGDTYFTFALMGDKWGVGAGSLHWGGFPNEYALLEKGWVYRSKEEAEAVLPKVAKEMGVEYEI